MIWNGSRSAIRMAEELVTAALSDLRKPQPFETANDLSRAHRVTAGQVLTSSCCKAMYFFACYSLFIRL
jgi:hypothetical protein